MLKKVGERRHSHPLMFQGNERILRPTVNGMKYIWGVKLVFFSLQIIFFEYRSYLICEHPNRIFYIKQFLNTFFFRSSDDLAIC